MTTVVASRTLTLVVNPFLKVFITEAFGAYVFVGHRFIRCLVSAFCANAGAKGQLRAATNRHEPFHLRLAAVTVPSAIGWPPCLVFRDGAAASDQSPGNE